MPTVRDVKKAIAGTEYLNLDPMAKRMFLAMAPKFKTNFPRLFKAARDHALSSSLKSDIDRTLDMLDRAAELAPMMAGTAQVTSEAELEEAARLFPELNTQIQGVLEHIERDQMLKATLENVLSMDITHEIAAMQSASSRLAMQVNASKEVKGGLKGHMRKASEATAPLKAGIRGFGQMSASLPTEWGGVGDIALRSVLGPFAPIVTGALTGTYKGVKAFRERQEEARKKREMRTMARASIGLTSRWLGMSEMELGGMSSLDERGRGILGSIFQRGIGGYTLEGLQQGAAGVKWPGRDPKTGRFVKHTAAQVQAAKTGRLGEAAAATMIASGMFMFYNKQWKNAYWTKRVIDLLEGNKGHTMQDPAARGNINAWIGKIPWALIGKTALIASAVIMSARELMGGWQRSKQWGTSKGAGSIGQFIGGAGPGIGEKGATLGQIAGNIAWGAGRGAITGAAIGAIFGGIGAGPGALIGGAVGALGGAVGGRRIAQLANMPGKLMEDSPEGRANRKRLESVIATATQVSMWQGVKFLEGMTKLGEDLGAKLAEGIRGTQTAAVTKYTPIPYDSRDGFVDALNKGGLDDERP